MKTIVSKAEYAAMKNRKPSAISNWIAEGKISPEALVGEGVRAKIWVERADGDLLLRLDPSQQGAQAKPVAASAPEPFRSGAGGQNADDEDLRRKRRADADRAEHDAEAARRKLAIDEGRWVDAAAAAREWGRELARIRTETETFLFGVMARAIADTHGMDWKSLAVEMRDLYRSHCQAVADDARPNLQMAAE